MEVICRIGSLEIAGNGHADSIAVICRIGSLEMSKAAVFIKNNSYLPYRQLRNAGSGPCLPVDMLSAV